MYPLVIVAMQGLGDGIYQRPFIRAQAEARGEVWVYTPWPQLYRDLPRVHCCAPSGTALRTQRKNQDRTDFTGWRRAPGRAERIRPFYNGRRPILDALEESCPLEGRPFRFDLPDFGSCPVDSGGKPIAVIRPVTLRKEWPNSARAADPRYIARAAEILMDLGFHVVSVADVHGAREYYVDPVPPAHERYDQGELVVERLLALVRHAAVVVGGVGWIVPAAIAAGVPLVCIGGGQGLHNAPEVLTDPVRMDLSRTRFLLPEPYCRCISHRGQCNKVIPDFEARFEAAIEEVADVAWEVAA